MSPTEGERAHLADLEAEARYHDERYSLYRARSYGPRASSDARLRQLKQARDLAVQRLSSARRRSDPGCA